MQNISMLTVDESIQTIMALGENAIRQKALDVARQVALYLESHPELASDFDKMTDDQELGALAVQAVGETGYTALYDSSGVVYFHANPSLVGQNMAMFAETLPEFWAIFDASLDGSEVGSYYVWKESDNSLREKFMECVPVPGTSFHIAATTYIDEFYAPIRNTQQSADQVLSSTRTKGIAVLFGTTALALLVALRLSSFVSEPVMALVNASHAVEAGRLMEVDLSRVANRKDELGGLGRVFAKMVQQVQTREQTLKDEVADLREKVKLFIEIDHARRDRSVREITESDYFEELVQRAEHLRRSRSQKA